MAPSKPPDKIGENSNEMSKEYKKLLDKREVMIRALQHHERKVKDLIADTTQASILARLNQLEGVKQKYDNVMERLEEHREFEYSHLEISNEDICDIYIEIVDKLTRRTSSNDSLLLNSSLANKSAQFQEIKLPRISIPTFSAEDQLEWSSFHDAFFSLIDQNQSISDVAKLHYLRSSLSGPALKLISKLPITDVNYKIAWRLLCDRFKNKRIIVNACLNSFINQPQIKFQSAEAIRSLIDTTESAIRSIETLEIKIDEWDPFLVFILQSKLDKETAKNWEMHLGGSTNIPNYTEMITFLETQYRIMNNTLELSGVVKESFIVKQSTSKSHESKKDFCPVCKNDHYILYCEIFDKWSIANKKEFIKEKEKKKKCNGKHSTKLHEDSVLHINALATTKDKKLLAKFIVKVKDKFGISHMIRGVVDNCSEGTAISEKAAQLLHLPRKRVHIPLTGVDEISLGKQWKYLNELPLADPEFDEPNDIDLLFGLDIYAIILEEGLRKGRLHEPIAQNSLLGWLCFGPACKKSDFSIRIHSTFLEENLKRFWENEEVEITPILTEEHQKCLDFCKENTKRLPSDHIETAFPFKMNPKSENFLGDSRRMALRRFFHLEKKFQSNSEFYERYKADILSYLESNHMSLSKSPANEGYYLPHHAVIREESTTTKQRTVFDASATTTNGFSLNDRCLNGPTIQPELFDIFTRWRTHKIALVADIEKMYRQIRMDPEDRKYQKILWRFSKDEPIQTYELNTVTFGVKPAPIMAIFSTFFLADEAKSQFPLASESIKKDFYVDDCQSGSYSTSSAKALQTELNALFSSAHMTLRKWAANDQAALEGIPPENRAISPSLTLKFDESIKTLGMRWTPATDKIHFTIDLSRFNQNDKVTKRQLLSDASKLYDPHGILSPITIKAKIMMQELFKSHTDWDSLAHEEIQVEWKVYREELGIIKNIKIDRWFQSTPYSSIFLHGFCDASERAYAAVNYLVQTTCNITTSILVCSKTKVAPIDPCSIPRLELCGALLLTRLMNRIASNLKVTRENVYLWTDSSIVLTWLQSHASRWKVYVAHRVNEIQTLFPSKYWRHVRTHDNPADIASRGALPSQLINNEQWFHGPSWLVSLEKDWPKAIPILSPQLNTEERVHVNVIHTQPQEIELLLRFSDLTHLLRVTARLFRFINQHIIRKETLTYTKEFVTFAELRRAKDMWVKYIQSRCFDEEISSVNSKGFVNEKSKLKSLNPTLINGILVVQGRLGRANLPERQKFPAILPAKSHFTQLVINHAHKTMLHGSIHQTLARVRQEFWVLNGRNVVKSFIHRCITCFKQKPKPIDQLMAPLPTIKTQPARAFIHCGLDFAGPIGIKNSGKRNANCVKGYICVFVCMVSKAAHLELVGDLSTQKFILALRRFISRRGIPSDIYCDRAESSVTSEIANIFAADGITFNFNPPSAPSWGGQWESFVKLTKHHLRRMSTPTKFTWEEMSSLLCQIEACLNSRPLSALTTDSNDLDPLTAGHLLIGDPLNMIPEPSLLALKDTTLDRFQAIQKNVQIFWKRFYIEYLHNFQPRQKWQSIKENLAINDLVVIIEDNMPPAKWLMARVIQVQPSTDGLVRVAKLKTKNGEMQRPITKLCRLPLARENVADATT
ncbi:uncharacterized protein LOC116348029 [Contarinia nasturtii]|uniref:uncharacterized protein LOC116348029 n=1 Tax=Contarinia nasturtii TaxID=265458 RepID=UPI0012D3FDCE|nr:uncharacterized protein LOC116348029 [Contarinia nasturtii]